MKIKTPGIFVGLYLSFYAASAWVDSALANERTFDVINNNSDISIQNLTCQKFIELIKSSDISGLEAVIWTHGYFSAKSEKVSPFSNEYVTGIIATVKIGCKDSKMKFLDSIYSGIDKLKKNK